MALSIEVFDASSQHLSMKEKLPREVALTLLKSFLGRVSDTHTMDPDLRDRLITLGLLQNLSTVGMFGGCPSQEDILGNPAGSKRPEESGDRDDSSQNVKRA